MALRVPFDSSEAKEINIRIFETITTMHSKLSASPRRTTGYVRLVLEVPLSKEVQHNLWGVKVHFRRRSPGMVEEFVASGVDADCVYVTGIGRFRAYTRCFTVRCWLFFFAFLLIVVVVVL